MIVMIVTVVSTDMLMLILMMTAETSGYTMEMFAVLMH